MIMGVQHSDNQQFDDNAAMQRVLELANQGRFTTQPNPRVACVIVNAGKIVGEGYHTAAGKLHAEREALLKAGDRAHGATAYINLEPCCHQGRTPPCTEGLIDAGISRVVVAIADPNPLVRGGGFERLKMVGIDIDIGLLETKARWMNRGFIKRMLNQKPWVILKSAATLDGKTAAFDGQSKWITSESARAEVQKLRASASAIVTGIETVLSDDPMLNVRLENSQRQPLRVVLDSNLRISLNAKIIGSDRRLVIFTLSNDEIKIAALTEIGVEVIQQTKNLDKRVDLSEVLKELAGRECNELLVEAGQTLSGAFLQAGLVDELELFYAGSVLGDQAKNMFKFESPMQFNERSKFKISAVEMLGSDVNLSAVNVSSLSALTQ